MIGENEGVQKREGERVGRQEDDGRRVGGRSTYYLLPIVPSSPSSPGGSWNAAPRGYYNQLPPRMTVLLLPSDMQAVNYVQ